MTTWIIGDIHGCRDALDRLLDRIRPDPAAHRLILLGDLFDRGPASWEVLERVRELSDSFGSRFTLLRGNHEDYLLSERLTLSQRLVWERVGRGATVKSFRQHGARMEDAVPWMREHCQLFCRDPEGRFQCVHAGVRTEPLEKNDLWTLVHDHGAAAENRYAGPLTVVGHIALEVPTLFPGDGADREMLPPGEWLPLPERGILCIDTGCGKGGRLTAMRVEGSRFRLENVPQ